MNPLTSLWRILSRFYHQLGSPREFYRISRYCIPVFGFIALACLVSGTYLGLFVAPEDYQQGDSYRIIFVHVPAAWLSLFIYVVMAVAGTWWEWDARLTSELILLFLYIGIMALYRAFEDRTVAERATALLSMVGVVIVPIIHYSVEWWSTLHQGATVFRDGGPAMPASMLTPLLLMALGFTFFYGYNLFLRCQNQVLSNERAKSWVKELNESGKL